MTYHPVPQKAVDRPQRPSLEQHAPHVGLQTQPSAPAQVPSSVTTPVCHGGTEGLVRLWHTVSAGNRPRRKNTKGFIFGAEDRSGRDLRRRP